jgi:Tol biopolymer transport system component
MSQFPLVLQSAGLLLTPGARLGAFEILEPIGAGGMGAVYKARDVRLGRVVAIKVLLNALASQPDARARFEREARAIAGLNHPHICTIHDVGRADGIDFLVLELLDGETLAERLTRGPLPPKEAIQYAIDVADALDKAHGQGISHRDLKPGNIMLTKTGVKLLDFGLAKLRPAADGQELAETVTVSPLTGEGVVLGTLQYMAPEQLESGQADHRTDIFAFGSVLHEMLTGRKAFAGDSRMSLLSAIVRDTPPPASSLIGDVARDRGVSTARLRMLDRVIATCLAKDPDNRWQATRDLWRELTWIAQGDGEDAAATSARDGGAGSPRLAPLWMTAAAALAAALLAGSAVWLAATRDRVTQASPPVMRVAFNLPSGEELPTIGAFALSPDGRRLAYISRSAAGRRLHVRTMSTGAVVDISGTEGSSSPFFSPDGEWVGFFADARVKKVRASGGTPETLCEAASPMGGSWGPDNTIYFAPFNTSGVWTVSSDGGKAQPLTTLDRRKGETSHRWPHVLPGGAGVVFTVWTGPGWDEHEVHVIDLASRERHMIVKGGTAGTYVSSGHVVYSRADVLMAAPFDLSRLQVTAASVALDEHAFEEDGSEFAVSDSGLLAYLSVSPQRSQRQLVWVDARGQANAVPAPPKPYVDPSVSPDGRFAAVSVQGPVQTIWIYDFARRTLAPITSSSLGSSQAPVWTPDGKRLAYRGTRAGFRNLFWTSADGSENEERLTTGENLQTPATWSIDGKSLVYIEVVPATGPDVFTLSLADRATHALLSTTANETGPVVSPDGRWLAYTSNESGADQIYVRPFGQAGRKLQISTGGGSEPAWLPDSRRLFFRSQHAVMSATILPAPELSAGPAVELFTGRYTTTDTSGTAGYGVGTDGRLLMVQPLAPDQPMTVISFVTNWFDEVRRATRAGGT